MFDGGLDGRTSHGYYQLIVTFLLMRLLGPPVPTYPRIRPSAAEVLRLANRTFVAALLCLVLPGCSKSSADASRVPDQITVASDASPSERFAAETLQKYLTKITGAEVKLGAPGDSHGKPVIAVGPTAAKLIDGSLNLAKSELGDDGIVLRKAGDSLVITGADGAPRGTLYAVYEFLERVAGVRFWTRTEEHVPRSSDLRVAELDVRYRPEIAIREIYSGLIDPNWGLRARGEMDPLSDFGDFPAKMRFNGKFYPVGEQLGGRYQDKVVPNTSLYYSVISPDKFFEDHPEWFSLVAGVRQKSKAQLCMSNREMLDEAVRILKERLRANPGKNSVEFSIEDHGGACQCPECVKLNTLEDAPGGAHWHGIKYIADQLREEFPDVMVNSLAYFHTTQPPQSLVLPDNVTVDLAVISRSPFQPMEHANNAQLHQFLKDWGRAAKHLKFWDYVANLSRPTLEPRAYAYGPDIRLLRDHGVMQVFFESNRGSGQYHTMTDFDHLNNYLMAKLLWNPDQDERALATEFLNGYYGAAGPFLTQYLDLLHRTAGDTRAKSFFQPDADWMSLEAMNKATDLMDQAAKAVAEDPVLSARVRRLTLPLLGQWTLRYEDYRHESERLGLPFRGPASLDEGLAEYTALCDELGMVSMGYEAGITPVKQVVDSLRRSGSKRSARFVLLADPVYQKFLAGERMPMPPALSGEQAATAIEVHENALTTSAAELVFDDKAANHAALGLDLTREMWNVSINRIQDSGITGRFRVLAAVRVDAEADAQGSFIAGVQDTVSNRTVAYFKFPFDPADPAFRKPFGVEADPRNGEYHLYDLGIHELGSGMNPWVGNPRPQSKDVRAIHVDRFVLLPVAS